MSMGFHVEQKEKRPIVREEEWQRVRELARRVHRENQAQDKRELIAALGEYLHRYYNSQQIGKEAR